MSLGIAVGTLSLVALYSYGKVMRSRFSIIQLAV